MSILLNFVFIFYCIKTIGCEKMTDMETKDEKFLVRFKKAVDKIGGNEIAAKHIKKSVKSIERYKSGKSEPSFFDIRTISILSNLPLEWLAYGLDSDLKDGTENEETLQTPDVIPASIPVLTLRASAGDGVYVTENEEVGGFIQFNQLWLNQMGLNKADLFTIPTVGESMEPTIKAGEYLLCSRAERYTKAGDGIYVIRMNESILVKRLQVMMDDIILVSSDNSLYYKPYKIDLKKDINFQVLGKVILVHGIRWI